MNDSQPSEWFQARLRWATMQEGHGLNHWTEAEHIFLSKNRQTAFQEAIRLGFQQERSLIPPVKRGGPIIDCRFAEVIYLQNLGTSPTSFEVYLGEKEATERIGFDHQFDPEGRVPPPMF